MFYRNTNLKTQNVAKSAQSFRRTPVRTYERVVLEGSSVRIRCPHSGTTAPTSPSNDRISYQVDEESRIFRDLDDPSWASYPPPDQIRWFKNHVPLVNLNQLLHPNDQSNSSSQPGYTLASLGLGPELGILANDYGQVRGKSNQTSNLAELLVSRSHRRDNADQGTLQAETQILDQEAQDGLQDATSARNVNELVRGEEKNFVSNQPVWHINNLNELVIKRVSAQYAGKYTCLSGARWTEIVLDVLENSQHYQFHDQSYKISHQKGPADQARVKMPAASLARQDEVPMVSRTREPSIKQQPDFYQNSLPNHTKVKQDGPLTDVSNYEQLLSITDKRSEEVHAEMPTHQIDDDQESIGLNTTEHNDHGPQIMVDVVTRKDHVPLGKINPKSIDELDLSSGLVLGQPHKVHFILEETMRPPDLERIPGFLFTKQQIICPNFGLKRFSSDFILSFLETSCKILDRESTSSIQKTWGAGEHGCRLFANQLTHYLLTGISRSNGCVSSLFDLIWLKDGIELSFDEEGRGKDGGVNVKLIRHRQNWFLEDGPAPYTSTNTQSEMTEHRSSGSNRGTKKTNHPNLDSFTNLTCAMQERTLEIEGLRKENAGHYSCAYRLNLFKLNAIFRTLRRFHGFDQRDPPKSTDNLAPNNDTSCCDQQLPRHETNHSGQDREENILLRESRIGYQATSDRDEQDYPTTSTTVTTEGILSSVDRVPEIRPTPKHSSTMLDLSRRASDFLEEVTSSSTGPEPRTIQIFELSIVERSANSCDSWLTIDKAGRAYTRHKLHDYNNLKRSLMERRPPINVTGGPQLGLGDDHDDRTPVPVRTSRDRHLNGRQAIERVPEGEHDGLADKPPSEEPEMLSSSDRIPAPGNNNMTWQVMGTIPNIQADSWISSDYVNGEPTTIPVATNYDHNIVSSAWWRPSVGRPTERDAARALLKTNKDVRGRHLVRLQRGLNRLSYPQIGHPTAGVGGVGKSITQNGQNSIEGNGRGHDVDARIQMKERNEHQPERMGANILRRMIEDQNVYDSIDNRIAIAADRDIGSRDPTVIDGLEQGASVMGSQVIDKLLNAADSLDSQAKEVAAGGGSHNSRPGDHGPQYEPDPENDHEEELFPGGQDTDRGLRVNEPLDDGQKSRTTETVDVPLASAHESGSRDTRYDIMNRLTGDGIDDSLMWRANQYLYMHMRATAISPMFGLEVSVEWSNERIDGNTSNISTVPSHRLQDGWQEARELQPSSPMQTADAQTSDTRDNQQLGGDLLLRDKAPFATIDVIAGQNLQLQCTAQAFGRLPGIKWYKRMHSIPIRSRFYSDLARRIGNDLYWPLTELDLLHDQDNPSARFVCSQTISVFDNLINQTFTAINRLDLSQYQDEPDDELVRSNAPRVERRLNTYACIVDADVRHNFATLGVNLIDAPEKVSSKLEKSLKVRGAHGSFRSQQKSQMQDSVAEGKLPVPIMVSGFPEYNLYRESSLEFPIQSRYWVPIENTTSQMSGQAAGLSVISPVTVSAMIGFVLLSLFVLIYVTLKSYRKLTSYQFDEELLAVDSSDKFEQLEEKEIELGMMIGTLDEVTDESELKRSHCYCQLEKPAPRGLHILDKSEFIYCPDDVIAGEFCNWSAKSCAYAKDRGSFYQAHEHDADTRCIYDLEMGVARDPLDSGTVHSFVLSPTLASGTLVSQGFCHEEDGDQEETTSTEVRGSNASVYVNLVGHHSMEGVDDTSASYL